MKLFPAVPWETPLATVQRCAEGAQGPFHTGTGGCPSCWDLQFPASTGAKRREWMGMGEWDDYY